MENIRNTIKILRLDLSRLIYIEENKEYTSSLKAVFSDLGITYTLFDTVFKQMYNIIAKIGN